MKVSEVMSGMVHTCHPHDSLNHAAGLMWENDCGCLPVVGTEKQVVGMITDRDICMAAYTQGRALNELRVQSAMSRDVRVCRPEDEIGTAEGLMREFQIRRLPVLDAEGQVVGVISLNDIAREFHHEGSKKHKRVDADQVAHTLAAICAHPNGVKAPTAAVPPAAAAVA